MAKLGLFDGEKTKKVQFDEDTEVLLRHVDKKKMTELQAKANKVVRMSGGNANQILSRLLGEAAVLGWNMIGDESHPGIIVGDAPFPFNDKNRDRMMLQSIEFSNFVHDNAIDSRLFLDEEPEAEEEVDSERQADIKND